MDPGFRRDDNRNLRWKVLLIPILLTACEPGPVRDYAASSTCIGMGHKPGTQAYDACVREEATSRLMKAQRDDYERQKRDEDMWRQRRF